MDKWLVLVALATPVVQSLLMGVIGYPLARRGPGGMEAFHRSGFTWWLIGLAVVICSGAIIAPELLDLQVPSSHHITLLRAGLTLVLAVAAVTALELIGDRLLRNGSMGGEGYQRYSQALPMWARGRVTEPGLVLVLGILEEAVYRGIAMGGLIVVWDAPSPLTVGVVAAAFGLAHWFYGPWQVGLKTVLGTVYCMAALSSGWAIAAVAHAVVNVLVIGINRRRACDSEAGTSARG